MAQLPPPAYFWVVAREGGLVPAGKVLRLSQPTLSAQIHALEEQLGEKLFSKVGRKLVLTEMGRVVYRYADEIFALGRELVDTVRARSTGQPLRLAVGRRRRGAEAGRAAACSSRRSHLDEPVRLVCREDTPKGCSRDLALHALDIVISDAPVPPGSSVRAFNHLLGESGVSFFATQAPGAAATGAASRGRSTARRCCCRSSTSRSAARSNQWFEQHGIRPHVVAEFEDSALLKVFGADGAGMFPAPTVDRARGQAPVRRACCVGAHRPGARALLRDLGRAAARSTRPWSRSATPRGSELFAAPHA